MVGDNVYVSRNLGGFKRFCRACKAEREKKSGPKWKTKNPDSIKVYHLKYQERIRTEPDLRLRTLQQVQEKHAIYKKELADPYVRGILRSLGWAKADITPDLIAVKRAQLQITREVRKRKKNTPPHAQKVH
jgi:hypothetical protein